MTEKPLSWAWVRPRPIDVNTELMQCRDEGKDTTSCEELFEAVKALDLSEDSSIAPFENLLDVGQTLPMLEEYAFVEPSSLEEIRACRSSSVSLPPCELNEEGLLDRAYGAWLGRIAGCMLGKPVEGKRSYQIRKYLEGQGRWPLSEYFSEKADPELRKDCGLDFDWHRSSLEGLTCAIEDDDTNYTTCGLAIRKIYGVGFTPEDVAEFWLTNIPVLHTCTAERVAYRNWLSLIPPPASASHRNVYREWIGAQIRGDFFGYVCPGQASLAAEFAWRDACISHVKNGIYGEMWVAAMLAAAYVTSEVETVIRAGLSEIPGRSRLYESVEMVIDQYHQGLTYDEAIADMRTRWDESIDHHWCHTVSNAMIVAISLLWGERDFTRTVGYAVMPGFDTDCNAATAGSVLGLILGAEALPAKWTAPLNDTLETGVAGYYRVKISDMARETVALISR